MADLNPLIRMRKHTVEQKQKFLAEIYRQAEELDVQKQSILSQMAQEQERVKEMGVEMLSYFGPYTKAVKERVKDIDEARQSLKKRIEIAREDMRSAFAELKKIEVTQEARENKEEKERNAKESDELDDIALQVFLTQRED